MKFQVSIIHFLITRKNIREIAAITSVFFGMVILNWRLLISRELIATHDSIIWYGVFSYFADSLLNGFFPFWNPYMNCGEPFFLNIYTLHLLDPSTLLLIWVGKVFNADLLTLYHWDLFLRYFIFACGAYMFFAYIAEKKASAFIAFLTVSFSSLFTSYLRQHAFILTFYLFPWLLLFILKLLEKRDSKYVIALAFLFGISFLSYHSVFLIFSLFLLLLCIFLTHGLPVLSRKDFLKVFKERRVLIGGFVIFLLLIFNLCPVFLTYRNDVIPTVRMFEAPTAACSYPADFLVLVAPYTFITHFFNWNYMSESFLYIGLFPLLLVILALQFSKHKYKWGFIFASVLLVFLMLGHNYFLYPAFCKVAPFFKIIRNTHTFGSIFIFYLGYFVCIGADVVFGWARHFRVGFYRWPLILFSCLIIIMAWMANAHIAGAFPSLLQFYHILYGYNAPHSEEMADIIVNYFYKSKLNIVLFIVSSVVIFSLLARKKPNISFGIKYFVIIIFIFADLFLFHFSVIDTVTKSREGIQIAPPGKPVYEDVRLSMIMPSYPFYGFFPAMNKVTTAYTPKRKWITTHFYQTKDYYEFIKNYDISDDVKDILMGVSVPKLRFFSGVVVLTRSEITASLEDLDAGEIKKLVFFEEGLPRNRRYLQKSLAEARRAGLNSAEEKSMKVEYFDSNNIIVGLVSEEDGILYYSDGFAKAWEVFVDGERQKLYKANLAFKAVIVPKGIHKVHFVYRPRLYIFSLWCYAAGLLSLFVIGVAGLKRRVLIPLLRILCLFRSLVMAGRDWWGERRHHSARGRRFVEGRTKKDCPWGSRKKKGWA